MTQPATNPRIVRFGLFELDLDGRELRKSGVRIKLQEQPFQILAALLERPGEIVTREELQKRLWTQETFVDFDVSLNSAVKKLRQALGDDSENPRFIETLYRRGYRFIGLANGRTMPPEPPSVFSDATQNDVASKPSALKTTPKGRQLLTLAIAALLILLAAVLWLAKPASVPRISGYAQITNDGFPKAKLVTDGQRLYFVEIRSEHFIPLQVSTSGGETSAVPVPFSDAYPPDIAADGSALLLAAFTGTKEGPLFNLPLPGGSIRRLTNAFGHSATWSADRSLLVFASGSEIYAAKGNGGEPRKLATVNGAAVDLRLSPDDRRLRFAVVAADDSGFSTLWEMNRDGSNLHSLLPDWNAPPRECCGNWTHDGKYYVFQSLREGRTNLWLLPEARGWFRPLKPLQLTNGPLNFSDPVVSKDDKKIFAVGTQPRGELVRYNGQSDFVPYLGGISATDVSFSPDGKSVAYVSIPEGILWRSKVDGTQRLQLTDSSLHTALPRWSPDGKQIVFMGQAQTSNWRAYVIASDGGPPRDLAPSAQAGFDPGWSPDRKSVVLTLNEGGNPVMAAGPGIGIVDLQNGKITLLPGAAQLFSPRWSPDGKYIAALTSDSQKLVLFDFATRRWTDLATGPIGYPNWSHDGQYLYFDSALTDDPVLYRMRISDRKVLQVMSLKGLRRFSGQFGAWSGLSPDDAFLMVRDTSSQEIYALDWQAP